MKYSDLHWQLVDSYRSHVFRYPSPAIPGKPGLGECECGEQMYWFDHAHHFAEKLIERGVAIEK